MAISLPAATELTPPRLATIVAGKLIVNTVFRIAYTLIPFVALRYGVGTEQATWIVSIQLLFGLCSPLGGWLGDSIGYRRTMLLGSGIVLLGTLGIIFAPGFAPLLAAYGACGLGMALYQPAMQAYVGATTRYQQRGRAVGLVELSWALAGIIAVPLLVRMVEAQGSLRGAFVVLSAALLATMLLSMLVLGEVSRGERIPAANGGARFPIGGVLGLMAVSFLAIGGIELFFIVQPVWVSERFAATLSDLGIASLVFGLGELLGSAGSTLLTDRLGKRRAAAAGFGLAALMLVLVPLIGRSWPLYLAGYFSLAVCGEFAIVALLTFATTVSTVGRGRVMALTATSFQLGRAAASQAGVLIFALSSVVFNGVAGAIAMTCGVAVLLYVVHDSEGNTEPRFESVRNDER